MLILQNMTTGKEIKLPAKLAKQIFPFTDGFKTMVCLPSSKIIHAEGIHNIRITRKENAKRVGGTCIIRMGGIGDLVILSSSIVKRKKKYPDRKITLATLPQYVPVMKHLKGIDRCINIEDVNKYIFDETIDLLYAVEPNNIGPGSLPWRDYVSNDRSDNFDKLCGVNSTRKYFNVPVDREKVKNFRRMLPDNDYPVIGLNPTSKSPIRVIPPEYVQPLVNSLSKFSNVVLMGKTEGWNQFLADIQGDNILNLLNRTTEADLISVTNLADVVITPDTGALHIAAALKKKVLGLFGNIDPHTRTTYYPTVRTIYPKGKMACIPCWDVPGACSCYEKVGADCMRLITPNRIVKAVKEMLQ